MAVALLPVLQSTNAYANDRRKPRLGQAKTLANLLRIWIGVSECSRRLTLASLDLSSLANAVTK